MNRSKDVETEYTRMGDLWHFLNCAEQLVVNHERLHSLIHEDLSKCLLIVGDYQDELLKDLLIEDEHVDN